MTWPDVWSASTAVGTIAMAITTAWVIRQGKQQRKDVERQHRDQFKPICCLGPYDGVDAWNRRQALIETVAPSSDNPSVGTVAVHCLLQNVGMGPALELRLRFRVLDMNGWLSEPWELSPLGAGEKLGGEGNPLLIPLPLNDALNETDLGILSGRLWEIRLEYRDVFGQQFISVHSKRAFDSDLATFTWDTPAKGDRQKATMRPIPWLTYREVGSSSAATPQV